MKLSSSFFDFFRMVMSSLRWLDVVLWQLFCALLTSFITLRMEQVLLATGGGNLVYIEIGQGTLGEVVHVQLEYEISCLDINPVGDNPERSNLVAVGMWTDISVRVFALPSLTLITKEMLGGEIIPRSVLFCSFDGVRFFFHHV